MQFWGKCGKMGLVGDPTRCWDTTCEIPPKVVLTRGQTVGRIKPLMRRSGTLDPRHVLSLLVSRRFAIGSKDSDRKATM